MQRGPPSSRGHRELFFRFACTNTLFSSQTIFVFNYVSVGGVCAHECGTHRVQEKESEPLELQLLAVVSHEAWMLGTTLRSLQEQQVLS